MTLEIRITEIEVITASASRRFNFDHPFSALIGPVGCGKSGLLMLIKYAVGGKAALTPAVRAHVTQVRLRLNIAGTRLTLARRLPAPNSTEAPDYVEVLSPDADVPQRLFIEPHEGRPSLSDHLLTLLGLPPEPRAASETSKGQDLFTLHFQDIMAYLYIEATSIDRNIVGAAGNKLDAARKSYFELAFGLTTPRIRELQRREAAFNTAHARHRREIKTITDFLKSNRIPKEGDLTSERIRLLEQIRDLSADLEQLRTVSAAAPGPEPRQTTELEQLTAQTQDLRDNYAVQRRTVAARRALVAQLELDLARDEQTREAAQLLGRLSFDRCPRCMQRLPPQEDDTCCPLCQQPEPSPVEADIAGRTEHLARITAQLEETRTLLAQDQRVAEETAARARTTQLRMHALRHRIDAATREHVAPLLAQIAEVSAAKATAMAQVHQVDEIAAILKKLSDLRENAQKELNERDRAASDIKHLVDSSGQARDRVEAFNLAFKSEVESLGIPGIQEAHIDLKDYLPRVNGAKFGEIQASGGGVTTAVHVAYSLALLTTAIDDPNVDLPTLLIIDSPQNAIGGSQLDQELSQRIYQRFRTLADGYGSRLQLIIADNSLPPTSGPATWNTLNQIQLGYGYEAAVPGVPHPGQP